MNYKASKFMLNQIRQLSISQSCSTRKNHYDSLGLTKSATQADVKGAYYELSKVYHPDKNQGTTSDQREQHSQKFRDIRDAYEVLGNVKTRRLYDKGYLGDTSHTYRPTTEDPLHNFYKSRETRHRHPPPSGSTPIYDFDEWSKRHYGNAFRRSQEIKDRHAFYAKMKADEKEEQKIEIMLWGVIFFLGFCMFLKEVGNTDVVVHLSGANRRVSVKDAD